jgi:hypothetical protein
MNTPTTYTVLTHYNGEWHPRAFTSKQLAQIVFNTAIGDSLLCRVLVNEFDVETGAYETGREITGDFADTLQEVA